MYKIFKTIQKKGKKMMTQVWIIVQTMPKNEKNQHDEEDVTKFVNETLNTETGTDEIPDNKYFKGFWAFAMWGYIPPPGYEENKCTLITTVVDEGKKKTVKKWKGGTKG